MNKKQKEKVIELRKNGMGYKRISGHIRGVSRDSVRGFIKSKWFKENHPELVDINNYKAVEHSNVEIDYGKGICEYCGDKYPKKASNQKYCCPECSRLDKKINKYCVECGDILPKGRHKYCSDKCRYKNNYSHESIAGTKKNCEYCGEEFISYYGKIHCSDECKEKDYTYNPDRDLGTRVCSVCGEELPATLKNFDKSKGSKGGLRSDCKKCRDKKDYKYKIICEWCGEEKEVKRSDQRFCSTECQYEWQRNSDEFRKLVKKNLGVGTKKEIRKKFIINFENKFPNFRYHSEYTGSDDYFKMECRKCGHIQERNAQCARPSNDASLTCDKCEERKRRAKLKSDKINNIINLIKTEIKSRREHIKPEIEAIKKIAKNHRYHNQCDRCGKNYFTNRSNSVHCDNCIDEIELEKTNRISNWKGKHIKCKECGERFEMRSSRSKFCSPECGNKNYYRTKELKRRKRLQENGKINYRINKKRLIEREGDNCKICGKPVDYNDCRHNEDGHFIAGPKYPSIDHIIPVAKGGTHTWDNVQLTHKHCNSIKSDKSLFEIENNKLKISI